jgi:hypothetical protein
VAKSSVLIEGIITPTPLIIVRGRDYRQENPRADVFLEAHADRQRRPQHQVGRHRQPDDGGPYPEVRHNHRSVINTGLSVPPIIHPSLDEALFYPVEPKYSSYVRKITPTPLIVRHENRGLSAIVSILISLEL